MTLKQIEAFYWASRCRNFSLAADRLCISVSSLSKRISELEASLGVELFNRESRTALLTQKGEDMLEPARILLHEAEQFRQRANDKAVISGRCRFGAGELSSLTWMPKFISALRQSHPLLVIEPHVDMGQMLELKLEDGDIDFAVIAGRSTRVAIASHSIGEAEFAWVAAPALRKSHMKMTRDLLEDMTLITMPEAAGSVSILDKWLMANELEMKRRMLCGNLGAVAGLLREGLGIGFLPKSWADRLVARGDLVFLAELAPLEPLQYAFQWRRDDSRIMISQVRALVARTVDFKLSTGLI